MCCKFELKYLRRAKTNADARMQTKSKLTKSYCGIGRVKRLHLNVCMFNNLVREPAGLVLMGACLGMRLYGQQWEAACTETYVARKRNDRVTIYIVSLQTPQIGTIIRANF